MKTLFCLLVLFGLALASKELQFAQWMTKFNKEYSSDTEMAYRFGIFSAKLDAIEQWNNEGHSWKKGINQFSDLTTEEFAEQYLMTPYTVEGATADSGTDISSNVDWVSAGAVTAVKNQHQCGSCWAFGTVESIEGCYQLAGYDLTSLSEQQLVDCVSGVKYNCDGCDGGTHTGAMNWMIDNDIGLETEDDYPYTSLLKTGTCSESSSDYLVYITSVATASTEATLQKAALNAPVAVAINAENLSDYESGIYCPSTCTVLLLDHIVLVTGMDSSTNAYTIKNSWGDTWGEDGYFYLCGGENKCGVGSDVAWPKGCSS